ncbi:MAG: ParB/RepB/Spo0J family partition protein [Bacteroidales bacterium]|jgi:ParB family chromosome partitioning protein|nr:ParB/RepB/Spo0J family partition protein [Bacteroidales bacterium]
MGKKDALGRGLGALIKQSETGNVSTTNKIDIRLIEVNPFQPRTHFDQVALEELAASIKQQGIIQPITVREAGNKYQIISGERRYRASLLAGLTEIPAYVRQANDDDMLVLALIENVQREDLDAIEVAIGYQRLMDEGELTQENISERIGKKRSTIANYLRLLKLPAEVQAAIRQRRLSMGHARALVNIREEEQQLSLLHDIIENELSVREVEARVRQYAQPEPEPSPEAASTENGREEGVETEVYVDTQPPAAIPESENDPHLKEVLSKYFDAKVDLKREASGAGRIVIHFRTDDELQHILQIAGNIPSNTE